MIKFSKGHYFGIAILLLLVGVLQISFYWFTNQSTNNDVGLSKEDKIGYYNKMM